MFGWLAVCGGLLAAIAVVTLDVLLGGEPVRGRTRRLQTISEYVYSSGAWAFDIGVLALAAGSAALIVGVVRRRLVTPISPGSIFLTLWVIGLAGIVAFPKQLGDRSQRQRNGAPGRQPDRLPGGPGRGVADRAPTHKP